MTDPISNLRQGIIDYLQYDFKVYDTIIDPAVKLPAFVITSITATPEDTKGGCYEGWSCDVALSVYNDAATRGGNLTTDALAESVLAMVEDSNFLLSNFKCLAIDLNNTSTSGVNLFNRILYRRDFNITFKIVENG
jgi:hypothetical protein